VRNYVGRTVDQVAYRGVFPSMREQLLAQSLVGACDGGQVCTGIQKLVQHFLFLLLTKKGSLQHQPTIGTTFMLQAEAGGWRTSADVTIAFGAALLDLKRQLRAVALAADPLDEQIADAILTGVGFQPGAVSLSIALSTLAGPTYTFVVPISVLVH
jgi:hypothetical protein